MAKNPFKNYSVYKFKDEYLKKWTKQNIHTKITHSLIEILYFNLHKIMWVHNIPHKWWSQTNY